MIVHAKRGASPLKGSASLPALGKLAREPLPKEQQLPRGREAPDQSDADSMAMPRLGRGGTKPSQSLPTLSSKRTLSPQPSSKSTASTFLTSTTAASRSGALSVTRVHTPTAEVKIDVPGATPAGLFGGGGAGPSKVTLGAFGGGGKAKGKRPSLAKLRQAGSLVKQEVREKSAEEKAAERARRIAENADRYAEARKAHGDARQLLRGGALAEAEAAASFAIETVPHPEPRMYELRSAIRTREGLYAGALDDALKAQQLPTHRVECKRRASARYWEARALEGLNQPRTAGAAYLGMVKVAVLARP